MARRFQQVDVFTSRPFFGNPVAVVLDAEGLSTEAMQRIARWTNLSETTFVLPPSSPSADYRLRIFTPGSELPFAGHPTLGSAHAIVESGLVGADRTSLVQECGAGLLPLSIERDGSVRRIFVTAPAATLRPLDALHFDSLVRALGVTWEPRCTPTLVHVGPTWLIVQMTDDAAVSRLQPDMAALAQFSRTHRLTGVTVFATMNGGPEAIRVRSFAPAEGVPEDPVCGSGNAAVGAYVANDPDMTRLLPAYSASQGQEIGRDGRVEVRLVDGRVRIGGECVTCIDGTLTG